MTGPRYKPLLTRQDVPESGRQPDIPHFGGTGKERGYLRGRKARDAAAYLGDEESLFGVPAGKLYEPVDIWRYGPDAALHGGYGVTLALQTDTLPPYGAETLVGETRGTAAVHARKVAPEDEYLVGPERGYSIR